ncbi:competence protein CoiA family protein [Nocardia nova]|nr:hypothetical protein [Nocardia nova]
MRLVQTAVVGHRKSDDPVLMPFDTLEALALRAALANRSLWCGHLLGGCGKQLTMRIGAIKIPHFAHHPDSRSGSVECRRANLDASSADHLYINRGLTRLLRHHGLQPGGTRFDGQFASGGGCQRLTLDIPHGDGAIVVALRGVNLDTWRDEEDELLRRRSWVNWLFGPGLRAPADLLDRDGRSFHLRFENRPAGRTLLVGAQVTGQPTEWTELERSRIDKAGFSTPYSRALRSPHPESTASAPIPAVDPVPGIEAAPAGSDRETSAAASSGSSAYQSVVELEDGSEVALVELRSLLGRLSRRYGFLNQRDKAFVCMITRAH